MAFELSAFLRSLAPDKEGKPDHPIADETEARKLVASLPMDDPAGALGELTHWVVSMNEDASFSAGRRARVLMELDVAAHELWRPVGGEFLAPGGLPLEGKDGDPKILQALQQSATEFARGFELSLTEGALRSQWIRANLVAVTLRRGRWLTRKMILSRMLHLPGADERWAELHRYYHFAVEHQVYRHTTGVLPGVKRKSSAKQEYIRMLLMDLIRPDRMLGRDIEFAFRILGRIAASVQLEPDALPGALHLVVPEEGKRPIAIGNLPGKPPKSALYIDTSNALPRLRALLEHNMDQDPSDPDPSFGMVFTIRERRALINLMLEPLASKPPQRRGQRVPIKSTASVHNGFEAAAKVVPPLAQGDTRASGAQPRLRIELDASEQRARAPRAIALALKGSLYDASTSGLGVEVLRRDARWAKLGALVAVCIEPGNDWLVGVLRRMNSDKEQLRMGISIIARKPRLAWFHLEQSGHTTVWEREKRYERNFLEHFQRGILLDPGPTPLAAGEMLLPPGTASRGSSFDLPLPQGMQRLQVTTVREETHDFQRVVFEPRGMTAQAPAKSGS